MIARFLLGFCVGVVLVCFLWVFCRCFTPPALYLERLDAADVLSDSVQSSLDAGSYGERPNTYVIEGTAYWDMALRLRQYRLSRGRK